MIPLPYLRSGRRAVFLGGPITAIPFVIWYVKSINFLCGKRWMFFAPGLVIAHVFGRLDAFHQAVAMENLLELRWIETLFRVSGSTVSGINLHPTQIYEAASLLILFFGCCMFLRGRSSMVQVALTYFAYYPIIRSIIEIYRGDLIRRLCDRGCAFDESVSIHHCLFDRFCSFVVPPQSSDEKLA